MKRKKVINSVLAFLYSCSAAYIANATEAPYALVDFCDRNPFLPGCDAGNCRYYPHLCAENFNDGTTPLVTPRYLADFSFRQDVVDARLGLLAKTTGDNATKAQSYVNRGFIFLAAHQFDKALKDFEKAKNLSPMDAKIYHGMGKAYLGLKNWGSAISNLSVAISLIPNNYPAYYDRTIAYMGKGELAKAISDVSLLIANNPTHNRYNNLYAVRGYLYMANGEWKNAKADLDKSVSLWPKDIYGHKYLALYYWQAERNKDKALASMQTAISNGLRSFSDLYDTNIFGTALAGLNTSSEFKALISRYGYAPTSKELNPLKTLSQPQRLNVTSAFMASQLLQNWMPKLK
jgi:tetratricopeptide (TPR) repeat protein